MRPAPVTPASPTTPLVPAMRPALVEPTLVPGVSRPVAAPIVQIMLTLLCTACMRTPLPAASSPRTPVTAPDAAVPRAPLFVLEARREAATAELVTRSRDELAAIRALGRVGDPSAIAELRRILADPDPTRREAAARALGMAALLGADVGDAEARLIALWPRAEASERAVVAETLGRLGGAASLPTLGDGILPAEFHGVREAAAIALGVLGRRGVALDAPTRARLIDMPRTSELGPAASYALAHEHAPPPDKYVLRWLRFGWDGHETDALRLGGLIRRKGGGPAQQCVARALPFTAFQAGHDPLGHLLALRDAELLPWVLEYAVRTLQPAPNKPRRPHLRGGVPRRPGQPAPIDESPSLAAARQILAALTCVPGEPTTSTGATRKQLLAAREAVARAPIEAPPGVLLTAPYDPRAFELALARIDCQLARLLTRDPAWRAPLTCGREGVALDPAEPKVLTAAALADGLGGTWPASQVPLAALLTDPDARVRIAAITAAAKLWDAPASAAAVDAWMLTALDDRVLGVVGAAADAIAERHRRPEPRPPRLGPGTAVWQKLAARASGAIDREPELYTTLVGALAATGAAEAAVICEPGLRHVNPSVRAAARTCLKDLRGADPGPQTPTAPPTPPALDPTSLQNSLVRWVLTTEYGPLTIDLDPEVAPWAVAMIVELTQRGYYDGLGFHRDVPGFVLQGGDPEGTGWGGPGYTLPSEPSERRFEAGAVGIADAGKDTGGSQFFFMHARAPHLEGRYTWVGQLRAPDRERLALLSLGDRILKAEVFITSRGEHATMPADP